MSFFRAFGSVAVILNAVLVAYFALIGTVVSIVNLELAAIGSVAILSATYFGYKQMIEKKLELEKSEQNLDDSTESADDEDEEPESPSKISAITQSYQGYLFPLRIVTYAVFAGSFIYLSTSGSLEVAAFFVGLGVAPISVLIAMFWTRDSGEERG